MSVKALLDTGSSTSILRADIFREMCKNSNRTEWVKPCGPIYGFGEQRIKTLGMTSVKMDGLGAIPVTIVENVRHKCIIGNDALKIGNAVLNLSTNVLCWFNKIHNVERYPLFGCGEACLSEGIPLSGHKEIDEILEQYQDLVPNEYNPSHFTGKTQITINTGDAWPIKQRPYRTALAKRKLVEKEIQEMLEAGVISPSCSPWASPITLVPKKNGSVRFCVDYRKGQ